jgi:hypothetical protein
MAAWFLSRKKRSFAEWWRAPATAADRIWGFIFGGLGGFWVGLLGRLFFGSMPVSFAIAAQWALGTALALALVGIALPKTVSCVCFPFALFGPGGS